MKTITRIVIILFAALIVVGITITVTNSSGTAQAASNFQDSQPPQIVDGSLIPGERPEGGSDREDGTAFGWLRHLVPISAIIFVVLMIERFWRKIFKPRPVPIAVK